MSSSILVADYGSSDSENEEETTVAKNKLELKEVSSGVNLLASTEDKSDSDADDDVASRTQDGALSKRGTKSNYQKEPEKLPLPSVIGLLPDPSTSTLAPSSIFANPFQEAEQHKLSILEQHVKLTSAQTKEAELGGKKKICWKFRNGRCRFGHKCKFAHDSDVPSTITTSSLQESSHLVPAAGNEKTSFREESIPHEGWSAQGEGEDGEEEVQKRKRRPGLSQTLIPSKKVMTAYNRQNMQENPWTQR
ncbi:uncharacterized protein [Asterias amurensis]|uniref:uncharacterized protein n=1 Tax=Asterias amurensis TaxID=7602 RepID=UPI003AB8E1C6